MTCQREEPRAGARGFFYGKSQLRPRADRKTRVAIHPCSGERGILAFSRNYLLLLAISKGRRLKVVALISISADDSETVQMPIFC